MSFKKVLTSDGHPIIIGSTMNEKTKFPPGFAYRIGGIIYTVKEDVTQEASSPMREVTLSDGHTEILPVESIARDLKEPDCEILPIDERFAKKEPIKTTKKKKISKKEPIKTTKKKKISKKKSKKNDSKNSKR